MSIEDQVRAIVEGIAADLESDSDIRRECVDTAVAALMRLVEPPTLNHGPIADVWVKWQHLDERISQGGLMPAGPADVAKDLWLAIKAALAQREKVVAMEPPETGVSLSRQVEALELCRACMRPIDVVSVKDAMDAALATLRWVQGLKGEAGQ